MKRLRRSDAWYKVGCIILVAAAAIGVGLRYLPHDAGLDGTWISGDEKERWRLEIRGDRVKWTEQGAGDYRLTREATVDAKNGRFRLERENDREVLEFLGLAGDRLLRMLSAERRPSFMLLQMQDGVLRAEWHGILAKLDDAGSFAGVVQPEDVPAKHYSFRRLD